MSRIEWSQQTPDAPWSAAIKLPYKPGIVLFRLYATDDSFEVKTVDHYSLDSGKAANLDDAKLRAHAAMWHIVRVLAESCAL